MSWLDRLERRFGRCAIPHLTLCLVGAQALGFLLVLARPDVVDRMALVPARVLEGEAWRLLTFLAMPPARNPLFAFFALYLLYLMGTALEARWGDFRYTLYLAIGAAATIGAAFLVPDQAATNAFLDASVFLAFAVLYPDFQLLLFFILPVRVKWLALLTWLGYGFVLITGPWLAKALVAASVVNYALFFGRALLARARSGRRRIERRAAEARLREEPFHTCSVCGATDRTHPEREFRYCGECEGTPAFCSEHLAEHAH